MILRIGLGVGLGVGVPILIALLAVVFLLARHRDPRLHKEGFKPPRSSRVYAHSERWLDSQVWQQPSPTSGGAPTSEIPPMPPIPHTAASSSPVPAVEIDGRATPTPAELSEMTVSATAGTVTAEKSTTSTAKKE